MGLSVKSDKQKPVDIADFYAVRIKPLWRGMTQESAAFWGLCLYVFFEYIRPQSIYPVIDFLPWSKLSLLLALVTLRADQSVRWVSNTGNVLFLLYMIILGISSVFAFMPSTSWNKIDILVNWVFLYFLIITLVNSEKRFILFMLLFLLVNFKMSQHGFVSYARRGFSYAAWGLTGSPGWFGNAADFAIQMNIFFPLSVAYIQAMKSHWGKLKKLFFYAMPVTALMSIIGSASRGAQLGLAAMGIWFLLKSRGGFRNLFMILLLGWALYEILPPEMLEEFHSAGTDHTSLERLSLWAFGYKVALNNMLTGVGYENWLNYCWYSFENQGGIEGLGWCLTTHNSYLLAAIESGLPGMFFYVMIILYIFVQNARTRRLLKNTENDLYRLTAHALDGGIVAYAIATFFFTVVYYPILYVQLAMAVALHELAKKRLAGSSPQKRTRPAMTDRRGSGPPGTS